MLAGRWILFPGTHACRHSLWQPPYARLAKTLDSFASPARSMKPLAMTCALAVACLHSKAQFEPHIAEGNLVAYWKAGAIHSRAITSITQVRGNLRRPSQWSSKRWPWDGSVERGSQSNRRTKAVQGAMNRAPWSATATLLMCRGSILRQAASLARRRASRNVRPRSPGKRQGEPPLGADVPRTGTGLGGGTKKGPEGPFSMIYRLHWNSIDLYLERETRLELATPTLARSCSTN